MTEQNFKYRTDPLFLRNQFYGIGKCCMPLIPKFEIREGDFEDLRLIEFDVAKTEKDEHFDRIVHFFLYDYKFECFWEKSENYIGKLKNTKRFLHLTLVCILKWRILLRYIILSVIIGAELILRQKE